ncbi:hypothetical protein LXL04_016300 [Taraxacum kok-saghyz]
MANIRDCWVSRLLPIRRFLHFVIWFKTCVDKEYGVAIRYWEEKYERTIGDLEECLTELIIPTTLIVERRLMSRRSLILRMLGLS